MMEFLQQAYLFVIQPYVYGIGAFIVLFLTTVWFKADAIKFKKDPDEYTLLGLFFGALAASIWPVVVLIYFLYLCNLFLNLLAHMLSEAGQDKS